MKRDLRFAERYPQPPERVWEALTDSAAIADWLMPNDFEPRLGHRFTFRTDPQPGFDGTVHCQVTVFDPPRRLAYTWQGGGIDTVVTFTLEPDAGGTKLTLEHTGFEGDRALFVAELLSNGWSGSILPKRLRAVLDRHAATAAPAS